MNMPAQTILKVPRRFREVIFGGTSRRLGAALTLTLLLSFGSGAASAQCPAVTGTNAISWTASSSNWNVATNWSLNCVPNNGTPAGAFYDVTVNGTPTVTFNNGSAVIDTLTIGSGATLQDDSGVEQLTVGSTNAIGSLNNAGILTWGTGSANTLTLDLNSGNKNTSPATFTQTNSGTINLMGGGTFAIDDGKHGDTVAFSGGGTINLTGGTITLTNLPTTPKATFSNVDNTISGYGAITDLNLSNGTGGTINVTGGTLTVTPDASGFTNQGALTIANGATLTMSGTSAGFTQSNSNATTTIAAGGNFTMGSQGWKQNGGTTMVNGTLSSTAAGVSITKGTFEGTGTVNGNVTMSAGTITPGAQTPSGADTLSINGAFDMTGGTFTELIGSGGNGELDVDGLVTLGGSLNITLLTGFDPTPGTTYEIIDPSGLSGEFSNTGTIDGSTFNDGTEEWELVYNPSGDPDGVELEAVATPEPGDISMLSVGLLALAAMFAARSRKQRNS